MTEATYIRDDYTLATGKPNTVDGVTFRPYRTGILRYARISDDGKILVKHNANRLATYSAYVIGHGELKGKTGKPKRFRDPARALAEAVKLFKQMQAGRKPEPQS